ncbi:CdaR family transcriptional regulator [uncultured Nocardioides sp.]|uniref:PucR family transcriptional regulator n=1 Tax=uncultured Nocardioides sp. TaxID=198441 RepID=UPI00262453E3|nr:helix-turn-helix domain-containing protein [uncultured Nocardioides sp.]
MLAQVQAVIDGLAERLQRSVVVNDPDVRFLCASPHYGDEDRVRTEAILQRQAGAGAVGHVLAQGVGRWSRPGTIPGEPALGMHARLCVPVRWRGEMLGMVLVVDAEGTLDPAEVHQVVAVAEEVAVLLLAGRSEAAHRDREPRDAALDSLLDAVLDPAPAVRLDAVRAAGGLLDTAATPCVQALVLAAVGHDPGREVEPAHAAAALRHAVGFRDARTPARTVVTVRDTDAVVLLVSAEPLPRAVVTAYAEGLVRRADELSAGRFDAVVGVGTGHHGWGEAWRSGEQAVVASRGAGTAVPGPVAAWEDLGVHAALLQVGRAGSPGAPVLPDELERLLRVDTDGRLVHTLRVFLDRAGNIPAAADELHVHRTTLYYRLDRIRTLAGLDLDDGRVRLALHVGLAMADLAACDNGRNTGPALSSGDGGHVTPGVACSAP